jgi:hypothetical protein
MLRFDFWNTKRRAMLEEEISNIVTHRKTSFDVARELLADSEATIQNSAQ